MFLLQGCLYKKDNQAHWRFAIEEISGGIQDIYAQEFKKRIEEASNNKIKVTVYPYGTIGSSDQITELTATGAVQFAMASPGYLGKLIPELQIFSIPFILPEDNESIKNILSQGGLVNKTLPPLYKDKGLKLLSIYPEGWQAWTTNKVIRQPDDFKGFKMRVMTSPMLLKTFESYGATPTALPYSEVYSALQLKMIDGQVNPIFAIEEMSFFEVSDYIIFPKDSQFITSAITSQRFFNNLTKVQQELITSTIDSLNDFIIEKQEELNNARLEAILTKKPNVKLVYLTSSERQKFKERSIHIRNEYLNIGGKLAVESLKQMEADYVRFTSEEK